MEKKMTNEQLSPTNEPNRPMRNECAGMFIYISIPITGYDIDERKFRAKAIEGKLKELFPGCKVFNPLRWHDEIVDGKHPGYSADNLPSWEWFMDKDIRHLIQSTHIYFDNGWEESRGCNLEHAIVEDMEGQIIELPLDIEVVYNF